MVHFIWPPTLYDIQNAFTSAFEHISIFQCRTRLNQITGKARQQGGFARPTETVPPKPVTALLEQMNKEQP